VFLHRTFLVLALGLLATFGQAVAASGPSADIMKTINAFVAETNANGPLPGLYSATAVVVDEFAPFSWSGAGAGSQWWATLNTMMRTAHMTDLHATASAPASFSQAKGRAYASVPMAVHFKLNGKPHVEFGVMAFILARSPRGWQIASQTWATSKE